MTTFEKLYEIYGIWLALLFTLLLAGAWAMIEMSKWADREGSINAVVVVIAYVVLCIACTYVIVTLWGLPV
jgi:hypothetical protein